MNRLKTAKRIAVVKALVEGCSIHSTVRMTGVARNTVAKLLVDLGESCRTFHDASVRRLRCERVQCDVIWSFCYAKARNVSNAKAAPPEAGDVWTWVGIDAGTRLTVSWLVGERSARCAEEFMLDIAGRVVSRMQLTTDGLGVYLDTVGNAFSPSIDYAQLVKFYGGSDGPGASEGKCSPPNCNVAKKVALIAGPQREHVSTSYIERQNLTMRMSMRRFRRLSNAFSKKLHEHECAIALHFAHYNWCRKHQSLGQTPAMAAGLANHVWSAEELLGLLESN